MNFMAQLRVLIKC